MSSCDDTECQCERRNEAYGITMGDVLAKGYFNEDTSSSEFCDDVQEDLERLSECEATDGHSDLVDQLVPSTSNLYGPAHSLEDNFHAEDNVLSDNALRIKADTVSQHFKYIEASSRVPEHSSECNSICLNENSQHPDCCDMHNLCKLKRVMIDDELKREIRWHRLWTELRDHVRSVFDAALQATVIPNTAQYQCDHLRLSQLQENVIQMCKRNSQQLLLMLIVQAQEFVVELKNRIKETLDDRNLTNVAEIFLTRILDGYDAFVWTAKQVTDLVKPVEEKHLLKFNLTWEFFNKALYENHIWMSEPSMRNVTGSFTTQLTKSRKRHSYQALFERYVAFVEEMMRVAELWPETERLIVKWNDKQTAERRRTSDDLDSNDVSSSSDIVPRTFDKCQASNGKDIFQDSENENTDTKSTESERNLDSLRFSNGMSVNAGTETNGLDSLPCHTPISGVGKMILRKDLNEARKGLLKKRTSTGDILNPLQELDLALRHKTDIIQEIANDLSESMDRRPQRQMCQCIYEHTREIDETGRTWWSDSPCLCVLNLRWLCGVNKTCPCLAAASTIKANELSESPTTTTSTPVTSNEMTSKTVEGSTINLLQSIQRQTRHSTTQTPNPEAALIRISSPAVKTQPPPPPPLPPPPPPPPPPQPPKTTTKTATTKATSTTHNHNDANPDQDTCRGHTHLRGSSKDLAKSTGTNHRSHTHNNHASHACHKQAKVEHIKRVLCNDLSPGDGDCSDSGSSQEDSCSTSSSTPRDSSRHCDCCYCEVFGPGIPSVAPVSRNYNEMRERLRQLLTKKKAKKCKVPCSPPKSPTVSSIPSGTSEDRKPSTCTTRHTVPRSNTPIPAISSVQPEQCDQRDLEALLEFIEGNQGTKRDNKKTEKKARQKQRKLEEMVKKAKEEAERQKLIELQKKTPEVTITVVDPQKPASQRLLPKRNLPEVSILPAMNPKTPVIGAFKQASKKKEKQQQQHENYEKSHAVTSNGKTKTSVTPIKLNVYDFVVKDSIVTKQSSSRYESGKSDRAVLSKNSKDPPKSSADVDETGTADVKLTKKERKKLRREIKKLEEAKANEPEQQRTTPQPENQPQIVTIKRVMESNSAEPTVTITLKGQTPAEDKVLFTLVNGQTKEPGTAKSEQNQNQASSGKKKKGKGNSGNNNQNNSNLSQQTAKGQPQQVASAKSRTSQKANDSKVGKQQQQQQPQQQQRQLQPQQPQPQTNSEKCKGKKVEVKKSQQQQQQQGTSANKSTKSKKDQKNVNSTQTPIQQTNVVAKSKNNQQPQQQQKGLGKKQNKMNALQQTQATEKTQKQNTTIELNVKKPKQQQEKSNQSVSLKKNKNTDMTCTSKQSNKSERNENNRANGNETASKQQRFSADISNSTESNGIPLSSQLKDVTSSSKINIENLKLPPGITITKVDAPVKPLPLKSAQMPKPVATPKQTTIIAAPMSGVQSNYPGPQTSGNVIVVDTGKLKQDLLPRNGDREMSKDSQAGQNATSGKKKKKKKKKGKNGETILGNGSAMTNGVNRGGNDSGKENVDEPARILHNPGSNMVTIRNPAFGPSPKIEPTPQAAIIKVSENGMVTIRSPALQQAINAGLTPPTKPDFIVKGEPSIAKSGNATLAVGNRPTLTQTNTTNHKNVNGIIPGNLAELRSRLSSECTGLPGLANIHISKVTNGQPIPESGINLKGTSITLTKVRSPELSASNNLTSSIGTSSLEDMRQVKTAVKEAIGATINVPGSSKGKKKKKRGSSSRHGGDDWNLVESVFTPKDIDLEDGEMDDAERELEAFKRFCLQSVPPPRKEKVNLNIKDIVLKKKSSTSAAGAAIAAN